MGNFIRKLALAISILVLLIGLYGFTLPKQARIEKSITIDKSVAEVWPYINNLEHFNRWSPWARLDPNTVYNFSGPSDGVGARVEWKSERKDVGEGSQEIVISTLNEYVKTALKFGKGAPASAEFFLDQVNQSGGGTQVRWAFESNFDGILGRYFGLMIDKWVGGAYEDGLDNLKVLVEKN